MHTHIHTDTFCTCTVAQSLHKDPKILVGIFQSFEDAQNKILFRALIRKYKRPVGWHLPPPRLGGWADDLPTSPPPNPIPMPVLPTPDPVVCGWGVVEANRTLWHTGNCNVNLRLVKSAWQWPHGARGATGAIFRGRYIPWHGMPCSLCAMGGPGPKMQSAFDNLHLLPGPVPVPVPVPAWRYKLWNRK